MKITKLTIALLSIFAISSANAEYVVKFPVEGIVFVQPKSHENMCQATARYTEEYARSIGVNVSVNTGWTGNNCNVDVSGINDFSSVDQLSNVGNYILNLNTGEYSRSSIIYGFSDGLGRQLIDNGTVYAYRAWEEK